MEETRVILNSQTNRLGWEESHELANMFKLVLIWTCLVIGEAGEENGCREQEFRDRNRNCIACRQCGPGQELSKECGFGYGEDARCAPCRPNRFKEDSGLQKCKPCLDCALVNRFQKANCTATSNAMCGDCLPGFYRKTKLSGFQDMECIPCGDPPPPYELLCLGSNRVNLVKIPSTVSSPRDTALAAVICSALTTVLLALLILCIIYCKRQLIDKKPSWSVRSQEAPCNGSELLCFDRHRMNTCAHRTCCHCHPGAAQTRGPVHLIPSLCCDETCSLEHNSEGCPFHSQNTLDEGNMDPVEAWPLMRHSASSESLSLCQSSLGSGAEGVGPPEQPAPSESTEPRPAHPESREGCGASRSTESSANETSNQPYTQH